MNFTRCTFYESYKSGYVFHPNPTRIRESGHPVSFKSSFPTRALSHFISFVNREGNKDTSKIYVRKTITSRNFIMYSALKCGSKATRLPGSADVRFIYFM